MWKFSTLIIEIKLEIFSVRNTYRFGDPTPGDSQNPHFTVLFVQEYVKQLVIFELLLPRLHEAKGKEGRQASFVRPFSLCARHLVDPAKRCYRLYDSEPVV